MGLLEKIFGGRKGPLKNKGADLSASTIEKNENEGPIVGTFFNSPKEALGCKEEVIKYLIVDGESEEVREINKSAEKCANFGIKPGETIIDLSKKTGVFIGFGVEDGCPYVHMYGHPGAVKDDMCETKDDFLKLYSPQIV